MKKAGLSAFLVFVIGIISVTYSFAQDYDAQKSYGNHDEAVRQFQEKLQPYGRWITHSVYGLVWSPYSTPANWRPYTEGQWVNSSLGWTWVSDMPWGEICFHYGRWFYDNDYGWLWYPDNVWAPAWVVWRYGDDWVGWAPLPPESIGLDYSELDYNYIVVADIEPFIPEFSYCFIERRFFTNTDFRRHIMGRDRNHEILNKTKLFAHHREIQGRVVNNSPVIVQKNNFNARQIRPVNVPERNPTPTGIPRHNESKVLPAGRPLVVEKPSVVHIQGQSISGNHEGGSGAMLPTQGSEGAGKEKEMRR